MRQWRSALRLKNRRVVELEGKKLLRLLTMWTVLVPFSSEVPPHAYPPSGPSPLHSSPLHHFAFWIGPSYPKNQLRIEADVVPGTELLKSLSREMILGVVLVCFTYLLSLKHLVRRNRSEVLACWFWIKTEKFKFLEKINKKNHNLWKRMEFGLLIHLTILFWVLLVTGICTGFETYQEELNRKHSKINNKPYLSQKCSCSIQQGGLLDYKKLEMMGRWENKRRCWVC